MRSSRRGVAALLSLLLPALLVAGTTAPAQAADVFRYWAYFTVEDGAFVAQQVGPSDAQPADGAIEAYRYAAPADFNDPNLPRADLSEVTFDAVCEGETSEEGQKRVAVLIDHGVEADSEGAEVPEPEARCAVVPEDANGMQTLQAVAPEIRTDGAFLCAINGYPATGCSSAVDEGTPADEGPVEFAGLAAADADADGAAADTDDGGNGALLAVIAALVVILGGGGLLLRRRLS